MEAQTWSAETYAKNARFVADLAGPVFELLAPRQGERILDLGCGDGALTQRLVSAGARVVGADSSAELVAAARALGLEAVVVDGHALPFSGQFDAVFSNAALHWMRRPAEVIAGVRRALAPGGRFVGEMGGHGNIASVHTALIATLDRRGLDGAAHSPWYFPSPAAYRALLEAAGFVVERIELVTRPTVLPTDMRGWLATFGDAFLMALPQPGRAPALDEAIRLLAHTLRDETGAWALDYVRLRFAATLAA